jgi:hypothetical protein
MHRTLTLTIAGALVVLAGCSTPTGGATATQASTSNGGGGGGSGGGGASTVTDPCTLLTQAEVSTVVGKQVGAGSSATDPSSCDFQYPADGVPDIQAGVDFVDGSLGDYCTEAGASALGLSIESVSGVGDGACFIHVGSLEAGSNLTFAKNGRVFQTFALLGSGTPPSDIEAADKALALDALARL